MLMKARVGCSYACWSQSKKTEFHSIFKQAHTFKANVSPPLSSVPPQKVTKVYENNKRTFNDTINEKEEEWPEALRHTACSY